jgi:hypothetical protein
MNDRPCQCGHCDDCRNAGADRFSRRGVVGALLGTAAVAVSPPALAREPAPRPAALEALQAEAFKNLQALVAALRAYYAERDAYTTDLDRLGFAPDEWCEDGARLRIEEKPTAFKKIGCHFTYEVETLGVAPQMQFRAWARGAVAPALGLTFLVESSGAHAGIPRRSPT